MYFNYIEFGRIGKPTVKINMGYRPPKPPPKRSGFENCNICGHTKPTGRICNECTARKMMSISHPIIPMIQPVRPWPNPEECTACTGTGKVPTSIVDGTEDTRECSMCLGKGVIEKSKKEMTKDGTIYWI